MGILKEVWLAEVLSSTEKRASFIHLGSDYSAFVDEAGVLHIPEDADTELNVHKNKTDDIGAVKGEFTDNAIPLDVYDTENFKIRLADIEAMPVEQIRYFTDKAALKLSIKEEKDAAYEFAPDGTSGAKTIIMKCTGTPRGSNTHHSLTVQDIYNYAEACDRANFPTEGRVLVLNSLQWWDVANSDIINKQIIQNQQLGKINPDIAEVAGFTIYKYDAGLGFDTTTNKKAAQGTAISGNVVPASFMFCASEVFYAGGKTQMLYLPAEQNTRGRCHEVGFQQRFKCRRKRMNEATRDYYTGMIVSAPVSETPASTESSSNSETTEQ